MGAFLQSSGLEVSTSRFHFNSSLPAQGQTRPNPEPQSVDESVWLEAVDDTPLSSLSDILVIFLTLSSSVSFVGLQWRDELASVNVTGQLI